MIIIILFTFCIANGFQLNNYQYNTVMKLIRNNSLSPLQREKINELLYKSHIDYSEKRALIFKKKHDYTCNKISNDEMKFYGKMGLYRATQKYNGQTNFTYYSSLYINYHLIDAVTDAYSLSILPAYKRARGKKNMTKEQSIYYNNMLNVNTFEDKDALLKNIDLNKEKQHEYYNMYKTKKIWDFVNNMDPVLKKVFYLKYDSDFNVQMNTKQIAELLEYTPSNVRIIQRKIRTKITDWFQEDDEFSNLTF
jgi:RNA polymerase sigma factor (sigma-70 family)